MVPSPEQGASAPANACAEREFIVSKEDQRRGIVSAFYWRLGRYTSVAVPKKTSAEFITVSERVG
jgi:hypothetical protein